MGLKASKFSIGGNEAKYKFSPAIPANTAATPATTTPNVASGRTVAAAAVINILYYLVFLLVSFFLLFLFAFYIQTLFFLSLQFNQLILSKKDIYWQILQIIYLLFYF